MMNVEGDEAMRTLAAWGDCYAGHNTDRALTLIATHPGSREEAGTMRRLLSHNQGCLGGGDEMRMPIIYVRGAIAEGLYKRGVPLPAELTQTVPAPGTARTLSEASRCYIAGHRDQVQNLIEHTAPGSESEFEVLSAMADDFFRCLPEAVRGVRLHPTQVRFRLAEALWRLPQ